MRLMHRATTVVRDWWDDDQGQDTVEYALIAALISITCIPAVFGFANPVAKLWDAISAGVAAI